MMALFKDRKDAGRQLAAQLADRYESKNLRILGLPRGGVPVAYEVACALKAPLDVFIVRKLGLPQNKEFAIGAIASGGVAVLDEEIVSAMRISQQSLDSIIATERDELSRREKTYRKNRPLVDITDHVIIVVDDGLATGATMRAAVAAIKKDRPRHIVVAVPVAPAEACELIRSEVDEVICLATPAPFRAVGLWYEDFAQTTDKEVGRLLALAQKNV